MGKNWLIRTKSNHILGPISKEKVLELLQNGSIKPDDEVCAGNGFWFFIREDDMVARFLLGREQQNFNPISEAKDVLTSPPKPQTAEDDITLIGQIDFKKLREGTPPGGTYVSSLPLDAPESATAAPPVSETPKKKAEPQTPVKASIKPAIVKPRTPKPQLKKQNYLQYLALLCFIALLLALFYRKSLLKYFQTGQFPSILIESAIAQEESPAEKKK